MQFAKACSSMLSLVILMQSEIGGEREKESEEKNKTITTSTTS